MSDPGWGGLRYFDRQGRPISQDEYLAHLADTDYTVVKQTELGPYFVSTVWLGLDHGWGRSPEPVIFETMVFVSGEVKDTETVGVRDLDCIRWSTEEEALHGHEEMCTLVLATTDTEIPSEQLERDDCNGT